MNLPYSKMMKKPSYIENLDHRMFTRSYISNPESMIILEDDYKINKEHEQLKFQML